MRQARQTSLENSEFTSTLSHLCVYALISVAVYIVLVAMHQLYSLAALNRQRGFASTCNSGQLRLRLRLMAAVPVSPGTGLAVSRNAALGLAVSRNGLCRFQERAYGLSRLRERCRTRSTTQSAAGEGKARMRLSSEASMGPTAPGCIVFPTKRLSSAWLNKDRRPVAL